MEFGFDSQIKTIRAYLWLVYPAVVFITIVGSLGMVIGNSGQLIDKLSSQNHAVQQNIQLKIVLENKLSVLKSTDEQVSIATLKSLVESVPLEKEIWTVLSRLKEVGNLNSFRNSGDQKITVEFAVVDSKSLQELLEKVYELTPLMSVTGVSYGNKIARMDIQIAFEPLAKLKPELDKPLPKLSK